MSEVLVENSSTGKGSVKIVYILYLVSLFFGGITGIVGLVIAYTNKNKSSEWLTSHCQFQIRTFWIGALYLFLGLTLSLMFGNLFLGFFLWFVWVIIRSIKGINALNSDTSIENPKSWFL
jgi:uncharacterized membrane protein